MPQAEYKHNPHAVIFCDTRGMGTGILDALGEAGTDATPMNAGDFAFWGLDPWSGEPVFIGVEHKHLRALLGDIKTHRINEQFRKMEVDFGKSWLMVDEGAWRVDEEGLMTFPRRNGREYVWEPSRFMHVAYDAFLTSIQVAGIGVKIVHGRQGASGDRENAKAILNLYSWYQKSPDEHTLTKQQFQHELFGGFNGAKPKLVEKVAALLDGVGTKKAREVGKVFPTVEDLIEASEKELMKVDGIGKGIARKIRGATGWRRNGTI